MSIFCKLEIFVTFFRVCDAKELALHPSTAEGKALNSRLTCYKFNEMASQRKLERQRSGMRHDLPPWKCCVAPLLLILSSAGN